MSDGAKRTSGGPQQGKKDSSGFWSSLADGLVSGLARGQRIRNPADPSQRMEPVRQDREETGREMIFRATEGAAGQAPMERVDRERRYVARSISGRGGSTRAPTIPQGTGAPLPGGVRGRMEPKLGVDLSGV